MTDLYAIRTTVDGEYLITKYDDDLNVVSERDKRTGEVHQSIYIVSKGECTCPRGNKPSCRHRDMLGLFMDEGKINTGWMMDWHTRQWWMPRETLDVLEMTETMQRVGITTYVVDDVVLDGGERPEEYSSPEVERLPPGPPVADTPPSRPATGGANLRRI